MFIKIISILVSILIIAPLLYASMMFFRRYLGWSYRYFFARAYIMFGSIALIIFGYEVQSIEIFLHELISPILIILGVQIFIWNLNYKQINEP